MQSVMSSNPTFDDANNFNNRARFAADSKLFVTFHVVPVINNFKSAQEGRPIYEEHEYITIIIPGESKTVVDTPVNDEFKSRFREQYARFKSGLEQSITGTPLEMWPQMTVGLCAELKAVNVRTVEQLAALDDSKASKFMGFHDLRRRAQAFLDAAQGEAASNKLTIELEKRDAEIETLKAQMAQILQATAGKKAKE